MRSCKVYPKYTVGLLWCSVFVFVLDLLEALDVPNTIPVNVAVAGEKASIPCNISTPLADDQVSLILWYRVDMPNPIYTLDVRKVPIKRARHFPSTEMEGRAYFNIAIHPPTLVLSPARVEDEADYKCRVDLRRSRTLILHTRLNIIVPPGDPTIMDEERSQRLRGIIGPFNEGSFLTLVCEVDGGDPSPTVTWWRGSMFLDDSFNITSQGFVRNELYLTELRRSDLMSEFTCQATNTNLTKPKTTSVILDLNLNPLEVKIGTIRHSLTAGIKKQVVCETTGSRPRASLSWWLDNIKLDGSTETVSDGGNLTVSTLTFVPTPDDNAKILACRAENPSFAESGIEDEWIMKVNYAPIMSLALGPSITHSGIREGVDVYLECTVRANPWVSEVMWQFEDRTVSSDKSQGIIVSNQTLVLQRVKKQHRGRYRCLSSNSEGDGASEYLHLLVQFAPVCRFKEAKLYGVARNEALNVSCEVEADPPEVSFHWSLNNSLETVSLQNWSYEGTRSVLNYTPRTMAGYGLLLCWAKNKIGNQVEPCVSRITPAGAPESPRDCFVTNQTCHTLGVECEPGYDGGLTQIFHLELYNSVVEHLEANLTSWEWPVFRVQGLPSGTTFVLVLYASNSKGRSNSVALMASTLAPAERRTVEEPDSTGPFLGIIIGAVVAAIVIVLVIVIIVVRVRCVKDEDKEDTPQDENTRCETPLKKELEDSQEASEKVPDPDIIPFSNECEVYFSASSSEQLRHIRQLQSEHSPPVVYRKQMSTDTML